MQVSNSLKSLKMTLSGFHSCLVVTFPTEMSGYNTVWVAVDRMTKRVRVAPTLDRVTAVGIVKLFRNNIWKNHGLLDIVISDRDL